MGLAEAVAVDLACGRGRARRLLLGLPPAVRDQRILAAALAWTPGRSASEERRGAYLARLAMEVASPALLPGLLAALAREAYGSEAGSHLVAVLSEMALRGSPVPPLRLLHEIRRGPDPAWRIPALRGLAALGDLASLEVAAEMTSTDLEGIYDAREWGDALSAALPSGRPLLVSLLTAGPPLVRLGAAHALLRGHPDDGPLVVDRRSEVLADLLAFDSDPMVRAAALEIREGSRLPDPYQVVLRVLSDPDAARHLETWHWAAAASDLPASDLPRILKAHSDRGIDELRGLADVLAWSRHPLAREMLRSRLRSAPPETRAIWRDALLRSNSELDAEELLRLDPGEIPLGLLARLPDGIRRLGARELVERVAREAPGAELVELVPEDLPDLDRELAEVFASAGPAEAENLWAVFHPRLAALGLPFPGDEEASGSDSTYGSGSGPERGTRGAPTDPDGSEDPEALAALVAIGSASRIRGLAQTLDDRPALAARLLGCRPADDPDPQVRSALLRLARAAGPAGTSRLRAALEDPAGTIRAEALEHCRLAQVELPGHEVLDHLWDGLDEVRAEAVRYVSERMPSEASRQLAHSGRREACRWVREVYRERLGDLEVAADPRSGAGRRE